MPPALPKFTRCPKCDHRPLPVEQSLPAACPACGLILAKAAARAAQGDATAEVGRTAPALLRSPSVDNEARWRFLWQVPQRVDRTMFAGRVALLAFFTVWGLWLMAQDHRDGSIGRSFLHGPLLVFHEAGHVLMGPFGEWMMVFGGTLGQLAMPAVLGGALLWKNRDPFGASIGLWLFGVSVLDVAPYVYDALHPQLILLSGSTGEDGGHDWIYLLDSMHLLRRAQGLGLLVRVAGGACVLLALGWAAALLVRQAPRIEAVVLEER